MTGSVPRFAWHIHHDVLLEPLVEPIAIRQAYILSFKPPHEVALRLRLLREVKGQLPLPVIEAGDAYTHAWVAYSRVGAIYTQAKIAYHRRRAAYRQGQAVDAYNRAWDAYDRERAAYIQAGDAYTHTWVAYNLALVTHSTEIEALHSLECPHCLWDGTSIIKGLEEVAP